MTRGAMEDIDEWRNVAYRNTGLGCTGMLIGIVYRSLVVRNNGTA
jgi:hypothetical protein